ncbi:unnamed protein product [Parnassius apollo]|uniref:(apollo) hypothetical protein n=1 Tax=Parnassius apollo TaxID=110799 RepID=A0A8S3WGG9_PARAO|nr:unnamed protein product [Parnassius apollo]
MKIKLALPSDIENPKQELEAHQIQADSAYAIKKKDKEECTDAKKDTCGAQNKNIHVAAMFLCISKLIPDIRIDHKFLIPGHTHMECDSVHAQIEQKKKNTDMSVHLPRDWYNLLEEALTRITNNDLSINKASKIYDIPKSTLSNKLNNKVPWQRKMGPLTQLTFDEENKLADWILTKAKLGFPMHPEEVYDTVEIFLKQNERENKFTKGRPGKKWLTLFLRRHPEVTKRNAEIISKARAAVTEEAIRNWFTELNKFLEEENALDIKDDPTRIFNSDETGVMTCLKTGLILGPKNYKNTYEIASGKEKESITVLCTFSADGTDVPPFVLYPYKRMPPAVIQNFPDTWYIGRSDSGWMVSVVFLPTLSYFMNGW